jgi:hypothetical protein
MLAVINDDTADDARRDCMAIAAALYIHALAGPRRPVPAEPTEGAN